MVAVVLEEDSSSLNDKFTIFDIIILNQNKCRIEFTDGNSIILEKGLVAEKILYKGQELSLLEIKNLKRNSELLEAKRISIKLVSKYLHPEHLLKLKLLKRGYKSETINLIIKELKNAGYLNDYDYAKAWLLSRIERSPESNIKLYAELKKRGIANEIAKRVISEVLTEEVEEKCIKEIIRRKLKNNQLSNDYLLKILSSKGFSLLLIKKILDEL